MNNGGGDRCSFSRCLQVTFVFLFVVTLVCVGLLILTTDTVKLSQPAAREPAATEPLTKLSSPPDTREPAATEPLTKLSSPPDRTEPTTTEPLTKVLSPPDTTSPTTDVQRRHVILVINIITAPSRADRREAIRATWLKECSGPEIVCNFFTDPLSELDPNERIAIINETRKHDDLKFMPVPRGYNFGRRILWLVEWSLQNYDFDYFLRVDDDYYLCLKKLLLELPHRPKTRINWGYLHCSKHGTRVDEGFMMFSAALAQEFYRLKDELLCGPYGGTTVGVWLNNVKNFTILHDTRLFHGVSSSNKKFMNVPEICKTWLGLHGTYPVDMRRFWNITMNENDEKYDIPPLKQDCPHDASKYDWLKDGGTKPIPCRLKPVFNKGRMHRGRGK